MAKDSPESIAFWGTLVPEGPLPGPAFSRLIISIFDHLRSTSTVPIPPMNPKGAKSYLNPEMIANFCDLMGITDLHVSPAEAQEMAVGTMDALYFVYFQFFCCFGQKPDSYPREGTNSNVPMITREGLRNWLIVLIILDPDDAHRRLNMLLAKKDHLFIDPFTEEPFAYPQIPRCAFPEKTVEPLAATFRQLQPKWRETRAKIMSAARVKRQEGVTSAQSNLATAELNAARMRAQASANAHQERRVYDSSSGKFMYSSTPGNF
ncbi:hypothetical protein EG329_004643 [Mollisiaceae sp. DMI_Dod_QoI]|nr:hypothetical protein EG329_004643 [Helotiales sp. DMI_Dod_QoI]